MTGGVISTTGIAGLTLGGGLGWIMARDGLALDNLLSADVVTADGRVLHASARRTTTCSGLRGGSGNFGVVASLSTVFVPSAQRSSAVSSLTRTRRPRRSCGSIAS